ncbi:hypothetical protein OHT52_03475 [Streptomyces sp. NBC_00247]|uniref:hypothetical protein n=1 Tax=Streptomyces sp. NBC_00247 TaxID=2975689 RepID=UPI002E29DD52|nr:hypothetical protein [Streptomyces sp. NBC_00247]
MIGTAGTAGRSGDGGRRYARSGPLVLGIALLLAVAGCDGSKNEPSAHGAPSTGSTPSPAASAPASPAETAGTSAPSSSPAPQNPDECADPTGHALRLLGHRISQDIIYLSAEEGAWDCSESSVPLWKASGRTHDIRIAETARIEVARPFNSSATDRPIDLARFLEQLDRLADRSTDPLVFGYTLDPADGSLVQLSQQPQPAA